MLSHVTGITTVNCRISYKTQFPSCLNLSLTISFGKDSFLCYFRLSSFSLSLFYLSLSLLPVSPPIYPIPLPPLTYTFLPELRSLLCYCLSTPHNSNLTFCDFSSSAAENPGKFGGRENLQRTHRRPDDALSALTRAFA